MKIKGKFNAGDIVEYSDGSVVSRTIVKKQSGTITIFAFDKGEGLSEHTAPHEAVIHIVDGVAQITIGGDRFELTSGESIILPANVPHSVFAEDKFKMILTMIR